jgi:hypothetical protein
MPSSLAATAGQEIKDLIPTALEQFRFDAEKPAISKACGDLIGSD